MTNQQNNSVEKDDHTIELDRAVIDVLRRDPTIPSFEEFKTRFLAHLKDNYRYPDVQLMLAESALKRGDLTFPTGLAFVPPKPRA